MDTAQAIDRISAYIEARRELEGGLYLDNSNLQLLSDLRQMKESLPMSLEEFRLSIADCRKCSLGELRTNLVFGAGNPQADIVFVGEAPGRDEDLQGEPFVGRAGKLLDKMLPDAGFQRSEVYICNILKCRPPSNRDPQPEEIASCEPHLWKQLEIIRPKIIVSLGRIAAQTLLKTTVSLTVMRQNIHRYRGIPFFVIYHPAAVLRNNSLMDTATRDLRNIHKFWEKGGVP